MAKKEKKSSEHGEKKKKTAVPAPVYSIFHFKIIWSQLEELLPVDKVGAEFKRNQIRPIYQTQCLERKMVQEKPRQTLMHLFMNLGLLQSVNNVIFTRWL